MSKNGHPPPHSGGEERFRRLGRRLLELQEQDRRRIARQLHDHIGQTLTLVRIELQALLEEPAPSSVTRRVYGCSEAISGLLDDVRDLSLDLRPPMLDDLGLVSALRWHVERQRRRGGINIRFEAEGLPPRLDASIETACFRVVEEALANIARHARGSSVAIELSCVESELRLVVRDDGFGLDAAAEQAVGGAGFGLLGVEDRVVLAGGTFECAAAGRGVELRATFPGACRAMDVDGESRKGGEQ